MAKKDTLASRDRLRELTLDNGNFSRKDAIQFNKEFPNLSIEKIEDFLKKEFPGNRKFQDFREQNAVNGKPLSFREGLKKIFEIEGVEVRENIKDPKLGKTEPDPGPGPGAAPGAAPGAGQTEPTFKSPLNNKDLQADLVAAMKSGGKYSQFVNVIKRHENVNLGNVTEFLKANYGEDVMGNYRTKQGIDGLAGALQNAFDEARGTVKTVDENDNELVDVGPPNPPGIQDPPELDMDVPGGEPDDGTTGDGSYKKDWKNFLANKLEDGELGRKGIHKALKRFGVKPRKIANFLESEYTDADVMSGFLEENKGSTLLDAIRDVAKHGKKPGTEPEPETIREKEAGEASQFYEKPEDLYKNISKDSYSDIKKDLQTRAGFYKDLFSGEGGKETVDGDVKYNISPETAKTYLEQINLDATQRMKINPEKYGRNRGKKIFEKVEMPDGTKRKVFTGAYSVDKELKDNFSLAERYDGGEKMRKKMFKELRINFKEERMSQKKELRKGSDATRYLTGFGSGDGFTFNQQNLKGFMRYGKEQREAVYEAARELGIKTPKLKGERAINATLRSISSTQKNIPTYDDYLSDFATAVKKKRSEQSNLTKKRAEMPELKT